MRGSAIILLSFLLLVIQSTLACLVPFDALVPSLCFPVVLYMSLQDHNISRGVMLSFVIGYFMDAFAGSPIGLYTFVTVAIFLFARMATLKLFLHGWVFEIVLTFLLGLLSSFVVLVIRAVFDQDFSSLLIHIKIVVYRAGVSALMAPFVFKLMRFIEQLTPRRRGEGIIGHG